MKYAPVIELRIVHSFYPDGRCPDFLIEPSPATRRWLTNQRCVLCQLPDGFLVKAAIEAGKPLAPQRPVVPWSEEDKLVFRLRVTNSQFPLFTDLSAFADNPAPVYTAVVTPSVPPVAPLVLSLAQRTAAATEHLTFPQKAASAAFALGGRPLGSATAADFLVRGLAGVPQVTLGDARQRISVTAEESGESRAFTVTYPIRPTLPAEVFADVELVAGSFPVAGAPATYEIRFTPASVRWRYYVVSGDPNADFQLDFGGKGAFTSSVPGSNDPDPVVLSLREQYGGSAGIRCLTSDTALPCLLAAPQGLLLKKDGQVDGEPLAPPPFQNLCRIDGKPAFFQIIRKTANP